MEKPGVSEAQLLALHSWTEQPKGYALTADICVFGKVFSFLSYKCCQHYWWYSPCWFRYASAFGYRCVCGPCFVSLVTILVTISRLCTRWRDLCERWRNTKAGRSINIFEAVQHVLMWIRHELLWGIGIVYDEVTKLLLSSTTSCLCCGVWSETAVSSFSTVPFVEDTLVLVGVTLSR